MIAGLYLGEVFRLVIVEMIDAGDLFLGQSTYKLEKPFAFDTAYLSLLEAYVLRPATYIFWSDQLTHCVAFRWAQRPDRRGSNGRWHLLALFRA